MQQDPRTTSRFAVTQPVEPAFELAPAPSEKSLVWAHATFGVLLGILFAVAISAPVRPNSSNSGQAPAAAAEKPAIASESGVVHADFAPPATRDLGWFASGINGLKAHLTTSWSEKLTYQLTLSPQDPGLREAFASTVADPRQPLSVDVLLKNAGGQNLCDQPVVVKYDPRKWLKTGASLERAEAQELERERAADIFQNDLGKDGKVDSLSAQGTMPCSKPEFEAVASWSFSSHFPDLKAQSNRLEAVIEKPAAEKALAASHRAEAVRKAIQTTDTEAATTVASIARPAIIGGSAAPSAPETADVHVDAAAPAVQKVVAYTYQVEGDDDIVAFDSTDHSIQTSAGNTFFLDGAIAGDADGSAMPSFVHYRCDQHSSCTLFFSDSTVLHATKRSRWAGTNQVEVSMAAAPAAQFSVAGEEAAR